MDVNAVSARGQTALVAIVVLFVVLVVSGCQTQTDTSTNSTLLTPIADFGALNIVTGQLVFVPAYGSISFPRNGSTTELVVTLAIHNTDLENDIIIRSVRYFDTSGVLVREFVETPTLLGAMATTGFTIDSDEAQTGWGTNFLVEWVAEQPVYEPVIEALMYPNGGIQGLSFISPGRIISQTQPAQTQP